jgi:hypothetical protein
LEAFAEAYEAKDQVQLRHVWPTLSDKQFKRNVDALGGAESIHITIQQNRIAITGATAIATCLMTIEVKSHGQVPQRIEQTAVFNLSKLRDGDWVVDSFAKVK